MPIELNALETKRFGIRAARVTSDTAEPDAINAAARDLDIRMITVRVGTDDLDRIHLLENDGYRLMDTLVYYSRPLTDIPPLPPASDTETIRLARPDDAPAVALVAAKAFEGYIGHYHADPHLSDSAADEAYVEWAEKSIEGCQPMRPAYVVEAAGALVAFMTAQVQPDGTGEIILNAVHPDWQAAGIYSRLLVHVMQALQASGCHTLFISTQVNNIAVQKAWARNGLRMSHSYYTLHKWY